MPTFTFTSPDGKKYTVQGPDGASQEEAFQMLQRQLGNASPASSAAKPPKPFGQQLNDAIADLPRQAGLAARYGLEGLGTTFDAIVGNPLRTLASPIFGNKPTADVGAALANLVSLPAPRNAQERIVGDAARMLAGGAVPIVAGARLAQAPGVAGAVGSTLAANPGAQLASAAAAGGAGGYTRETGGNAGAQMVASLGAGLAAPLAIGGVQRAAQVVRNAGSRGAPSAQQIEITINNALQDSGLTLGQLPQDVARSLRNDVVEAYRVGGNVSPDALRRLADYRVTGLVPTQARLTLDPADVTRQANLAKLGANSRDRAAQQLAQTQRSNNQALIAGLNNLGAATTDDQIAGATRIMDAMSARNDRAKAIIDAAYQGARDTSGRAAALDPSKFTQRANDLLDDALLGGKLPADVRNTMNWIAAGEKPAGMHSTVPMPFTVDIAEQLKTRIGDLQRATTDLAEKKALGLVRSALDDTPLLPGQEIGKQSVDAFNKARALNRSWMTIVERTPALQAVRDGIEPDAFVQKFIVGNGSGASTMSVAQLKNSIKGNPDAMGAVKEQIAAYLKSKALNAADDELGNFSQSAYNKALKAIGERKLGYFFSPEEVNQLKAIGRVAGYEQFQPVGAAVNNSNTAGAVGGLLERIGGSSLLSKLPLGRAAIGEPLENIVLGQQAGRALNVPASLLGGPVQQLPKPPRSLVLSPAAFLLPGEEAQ